ncbi:MAG: metallophosphoesterase [Oscillospiraceae bacterium]|jgi:hypothetical protein|nr:metallophosphoesterase [Oscillospiraceae bacterium]
MIYVTGDIHGDFGRFRSPETRQLKKGDTLLICGDFGFLWDGTKAEQTLLKKIGKLKYRVCFIDGVHENFSLLNQFPAEEFCGGQARQISGNLWHLMRGEIYTMEGKRIFTMGGGVSPDDDFRAPDDNRLRWEIPSKEELNRALDNLRRAGTVDYIVTHEPPMRVKSFLQLKQNANTSDVTGLNTFFEEIGKLCSFRRWFFGSMHVDKLIASTHAAVFRKVLRMDM